MEVMRRGMSLFQKTSLSTPLMRTVGMRTWESLVAWTPPQILAFSPILSCYRGSFLLHMVVRTAEVLALQLPYMEIKSNVLTDMLQPSRRGGVRAIAPLLRSLF